MITASGSIKTSAVDLAPLRSTEEQINLGGRFGTESSAHIAVQATLWVVDDQNHGVGFRQRSNRLPMKIYPCRVEKGQIERRPLILKSGAINGQNPINDFMHSLIGVAYNEVDLIGVKGCCAPLSKRSDIVRFEVNEEVTGEGVWGSQGEQGRTEIYLFCLRHDVLP